jgi:hypothetical protein
MEVIERHKALDELAKKKTEEDALKEEQQKVVEKVEEVLTIPEEIETWVFTIKATKTQAKKLKEWLENEEIEYK